MKKILTLLSAVLAITLLASCAPATVAKARIGDLPWIAYRTFKSEKCTYKVTKYVGDGTEAVSTDGKLVYELKDVSETEYSSCYMLTMDFSLSYGNSEFIEENFRGKTDKIHSEAIFRKDTLAAVHVKKTADNASDPSLSYSYEADYANADENGKLTATFTSNGIKKELKFEKGEYFDNDYMYYYVRALENMGASFSENITIVNLYDSFNADKLIEYPLIISCASKFESVKLDSPLFDNFIATDENPKDEQEKLINCYNVSVLINGIKTGPELLAAYSTCEYDNVEYRQSLGRDIKSKFIPLKYKTRETIASGYTTFYTECILSDFSITL